MNSFFSKFLQAYVEQLGQNWPVLKIIRQVDPQYRIYNFIVHLRDQTVVLIVTTHKVCIKQTLRQSNQKSHAG